MSQRGGEIAGKRAKSSGDGVGAAAAGEDLLSALPDDIIVLILLHLDTAAAVRTIALSRRWRSVWALLPELRFHLAPDGPRIREVLDAPEAPELRCLSVTTQAAGPDSAAAWLPVAARRLTGGLVYHNMLVPGNDDDDEAVGRGELQLPCFEKATTIELNMGFLALALPSPGVFAGLTELSLRCVRFRGPCVLGEVVSSPRCPFLKKLEVRDSMGLHNLSIHSESLLQMKLKNLLRFRQLIIVSPILQELSVDKCFFDDDPSELVANISAPELVTLEWKDVYDPRYVHLGNLGQVQWLTTRCFGVYGGDVHAHRDKNRHCLRLLQQFQALHSLKLTLLYLQDIGDFQYLMGDITMLPQISLLQLVVLNEGLAHAFGASTFHLLRMCAGLRSLFFFLVAGSNLESTCPSGCICDQPMIWKTEGLVLNHLEYASMFCLQGSGHEVTFVKQLLNWAPTLKRMEITFNHQISESKAREFRQALAGFSRPETYVKFYKFGDASKSSSMPLFAPEGQDTEL